MRDDVKFQELVRKRIQADVSSDMLDAEKHKAENRLTELSAKVRKLFDSHANGVIHDRNYEILMTDIQYEQAVPAVRLAEIDASLTVKSDTTRQLEQLKQAISEYLNITELAPLILNKLIERIEIGHLEVINGVKQQEITIVWLFAGET